MRELFPQLKKQPLCYLDSAATALKPQSVIDAMSDFYAHDYATVHRALYSLSLKATAKVHHVREQIGKHLNCNSSEIIFTRGTTDAINLVADSFCRGMMKRGEEVLIPEIEHHSNIVPWQLAAEKYGIVLTQVPVTPSGDIDINQLNHLITPKTRLFSFAHISNVIGSVHPVKEITALCKEKNVLTLLDAAQSAPHRPLDVKELGVDFLAFSGHKLYGPTGIGILFGREALLNEMPPYQGGGDMVDDVSFKKTTYQKAPLRFEAGTPMIAEIIGLGVAFDFINKIGLETIEKHNLSLQKKLLEELSQIKEVLLTGSPKERSSIVSFTVANAHPLDIATLLDLNNICVRTGHLCARPALRAFHTDSLIRVSFGIYNTSEDVDYFIKHLKNTLKKL